MKKTVLKSNLVKLSKTLKRDNLSIDQSVDNGGNPVDHIFHKIDSVIKSKTTLLETTGIYSAVDNPDNTAPLTVFKKLRLDKFIDKSIDKLESIPENEVDKFAEKVSFRVRQYRTRFKTNYLKQITTTTLLLLAFPIFSFCQTNIFEKDDKLLTATEVNLLTNFSMGEMAYSIQLESAANGTYITTACEKGSNYNLSMTIIGMKVNKNLNFTILYADILDKNGVATDYAYVGYMKREFGATKDYLIKIKKTRILLENNIYTESITINNGIILTIENKFYVRKVKLPDNPEFSINDYSYIDCSKK